MCKTKYDMYLSRSSQKSTYGNTVYVINSEAQNSCTSLFVQTDMFDRGYRLS
jgi:hypothetical protein